MLKVAGLVLGAALAATVSLAQPALPSSQTSWVQGGEYRLKVEISRGARVTDSPVLLVALHGDLGTGAQDALAETAAKDADVIGVGLLRPGYTDSQGNTSQGQKGLTTGDNYNARNTDAIAAAVVALQHQFHPRKTVLTGHSGGAAIVANILGRHPGIADAALLVSCPCDVDTWRQHMLERTHSEGFRGKIDTLSPLSLLESVSNRVTVTLVVGTKDEVAPPSLSERYRDRAVQLGKQVHLVELDGKDHEIALDPAVLSELAPLLR